MFENIGPGHGLESSWGYKRMHAIGSSSRSRRNWGAAAEADAIGEQQLKRTQAAKRGAAAEADTNGEQKLKRTQ